MQEIYLNSFCVKEDLQKHDSNPKFYGKGKLFLPRVNIISTERYFGVHNLKISLTHINSCLNSGYDPEQYLSDQDLLGLFKIATLAHKDLQ